MYSIKSFLSDCMISYLKSTLVFRNEVNFVLFSVDQFCTNERFKIVFELLKSSWII
jgi:hypothetical protein